MRFRAKIMKNSIIAALLLSLLLPGCAGSSQGSMRTIVFWHSYWGEQEVLLDSMVEEFNHTVGQEEGIEIEARYMGSLDNLSAWLTEYSRNTTLGEAKPQILMTDGEAAYLGSVFQNLASLEDYLSAEQLAAYYPGLLEEGLFSTDSKHTVFPLPKTTEIMYFNNRIWSHFQSGKDAYALGDVSLWSTLPGICRAYYNWSDAQTPQVDHDGKAFLAIESLSSLLITMARQQGLSLIQAGYKEIKLNVNREVLRSIWDFYYGGVVRGEIAQTTEFSCVDLVARGDVVAYLGSTAGADAFPATYCTPDGDSDTTILLTLEYPQYYDTEKLVPQSGAGAVVLRSTEAEEAAAFRFLDWLPQSEDYVNFCVAGLSFPASSETLKTNVPYKVINSLQQNSDFEQRKLGLVLKAAYRQVKSSSVYGAVSFVQQDLYCEELASSLSERAQIGRQQVLTLLAEGMPYEEAVASVITDVEFQQWYTHVLEIRAQY